MQVADGDVLTPAIAPCWPSVDFSYQRPAKQFKSHSDLKGMELEEALEKPAADRLHLRHSDAEIYILRIGHDTVYRFHGLPSKRAKQRLPAGSSDVMPWCP